MELREACLFHAPGLQLQRGTEEGDCKESVTINAKVGGYPQFAVPGEKNAKKGHTTRGIPFLDFFIPFFGFDPGVKIVYHSLDLRCILFFSFDPAVKIGGTPLP